MRGLLATVAVTTLVLAGAVPAAAGGRVDAGALKATTASDPWHLDFGVLSESRSRGPGPSGSLGFATALGWGHATRVLSEQAAPGGSYEATLDTTEPGRRMQVRLAPHGDGVIVLRASVTGPGLPVTRVGIGFDTRPGERYLGFGERSNAVDQRGREVENYVSDGPYTREDRLLVSAFVPPWGLRAREDATYFPVPWLLSTAGYGVLVATTRPASSGWAATAPTPGARRPRRASWSCGWLPARDPPMR